MNDIYDKGIADMIAAGYDMDNAFITQEGVVFDMAYARCPRCAGKLTNDNWTPHTMASWLCACGVRCDEPSFDEPEVAFWGTVYEED